MENILERIESKYPVEEILVNGEQVWPYLRYQYYATYISKTLEPYGEAKRTLSPIRILLRFTRETLRTLSFGFKNWFKKYDYIVLTDSTARRQVGNKYVNVFLDPIIDEIGPAKVLCIESMVSSPSYRMNQVYTEHVVSRSLLILLTLVIISLRQIFFRKYRVVNKEVLDRIATDFDLNMNFNERVEFFEAMRKAFDCLFRMMRPRAVLLTCYYGGKEPAVKAAKSLGINVVEVQHGSIGKEHAAYNVHRNIDNSWFPDYLLAFGEREMATFDNSRFISQAHVHPVGSYYISYIKSNYRPEPQLSELVSSYQRIVAVTLQWTFEKRLVSFVCEAAKLDSGILYMLIPREPQKKEYSSMNLPPNVVVIRDSNFYELMMYCDFHSTVNSTCALEAPSLGVQNILVDIDGSARTYYGKVLNDNRITCFVDTPEGYVDKIKNFGRLDRNTVCKLHKDFFATNYQENISNFVKTYLL